MKFLLSSLRKAMSALGWDRERHRLPALHAPSKYVVVSVDQLYKHLVLTGRQTSHADCIVVTRRFHPTPRQVVDVYVQMPDPWRYVVSNSAGRR